MVSTFIINNVAGNGVFQKTIKESAESAAKELGVDVDFYYTKHHNDCYDYICSKVNDGSPHRFYACGGDGTLREAANAVVKHPECDFELGVVPCGTGNDFVRAFTNSDGFLDMKKLLCGKAQLIDIIKVDDDYCINLANAGFDANVASNMIKYKKKFGALSYKVALIRELFSSMKYPMQIEFDDGEIKKGSFLLLSIANGVAYGGGYYAASKSVMNDGLMDVCYCDQVSRAKFLSVVGDYKAGKHLDGQYDAFVHRKVCRGVKLTTPNPISFSQDGEISVNSEYNISIINKALKFIVPSGSDFINK